MSTLWTYDDKATTTVSLLEVNSSADYNTSSHIGAEGPGLTTVIVQVTSLTLILLSSLIINSLVFVVFYRKPVLLTISNRFVLNLTVANWLLAAVVMPQSAAGAAAGGGWPLGPAWCRVAGTTATLLFAAISLSLLLIAIDRFCAIMRPLHYGQCMTAGRSAGLVAGVWVVAAAVAVPAPRVVYHTHMRVCAADWADHSPRGRAYTYSLVVLCFLVPLVTMCWVYVTAFQQAQRTIARAKRNSLTTEQALDVTAVAQALTAGRHRRASTLSLFQILPSPLRRRCSSSTLVSASCSRRLLQHGDDWRAARTGAACMATFTLCWAPYFTYLSVVAAVSGGDPCPRWVPPLALWTAYLSCALNPLVYVFRNSAIRREIRAIVCRGRGGKAPLWTSNYSGTSASCSRRSSLSTNTGRLVNPASYPQITALLTSSSSSTPGGGGGEGGVEAAPAVSRCGSLVTVGAGEPRLLTRH